MYRLAFVALAAALCCGPASATEVLRIARSGGGSWTVGERSSTVITGDGRLGIELTVKPSPNGGQSYYVVAFDSRTEMPVNFSARISDRPPQRTHFAARAEPGRPYKWGEHLPAGLEVVYVMYRPSR